METTNLSEAALALLREHHAAKGGLPIDDTTRGPYRELEAAGLVLLSRPFTGPRVYVLTRLGWKLEYVLARMDGWQNSAASSLV